MHQEIIIVTSQKLLALAVTYSKLLVTAYLALKRTSYSAIKIQTSFIIHQLFHN